MKSIKSILIVFIVCLLANSAQAIDTPDFIKKFLPDKLAKKVAENEEKKELQKEMDKLKLYIRGKNEQAAIQSAKKIVANPLFNTNAKKIKFADDTGEKIIRNRPGAEAGEPLTGLQKHSAKQISLQILPQKYRDDPKKHSW